MVPSDTREGGLGEGRLSKSTPPNKEGVHGRTVELSSPAVGGSGTRLGALLGPCVLLPSVVPLFSVGVGLLVPAGVLLVSVLG